MRVLVLGHHSRRARAERLAEDLHATLLMDEHDEGAWAAHKRAIEHTAEHGRTIVVEDDAIPVPGFITKAEALIRTAPDHLWSFYLGTGHPTQWMREVDTQWATGTDIIRLPKLIHGVAYTIPPNAAERMLHTLTPGPADYAIGDAYRTVTGLDVLYPRLSLVDHDDGPSITQRQRTRGARQPRHARALAD